MKKALHTKTIWKSNFISDIKIAKEAGFEAIEMAGTKVWDYFETGLGTDYVNEKLKEHDMKIISINDIAHIERTDDESIKKMLWETHKLCQFSKEIDNHCIQLVPLLALEGRPWEEVRRLTANNIRRIADIGKQYDVKFQLEPVAWSPIHSISQTVELIEEVGRDNFGTVIDFWHLYYGSKTTPEEVAKLDKNLIYNIHFCDGKKNPPGTECDETILRGHMAGEGDINLQEWVDAVKATGYNEYMSYELVSAKHWGMDTREIAQITSKILDKYI